MLSNLLDSTGEIPTYICGDFNLDILKYNSCANVSCYIDTLFSQGFIQTITMPTRCTSHSATLIDHCVTNVLTNSYESLILTTKLSDHFPILINVNCNKPTKCQKTVSFRDFSATNMNNFRTALQAESWDNVLDCNDAQQSYNLFADKFLSLHNLFFPLRTCSYNKNVHKLESWYTEGLVTSRRNKIRLDKLASISPTPFNINTYKSYRNLYNKILRLAKKMYFETELGKAKSNLKKTWELIRKAVNLKNKKSSGSINNLLINNVLSTTPLEIAEHFNNFFATVPNLIVNNVRKVPVTPDTPPDNNIPIFKLSNSAVTAQEVIETVKLLESKTSVDMNGLSMLFVKKFIWTIATPLAHIFNNSFVTSVVPDQFKISKVIPIFKGGDTRLADNYRPISLISNISKIIEKIMACRLTAFLDHHSLITNFSLASENIIPRFTQSSFFKIL